MENPNPNENNKTQITTQFPPQTLPSMNPYPYFPQNYTQIPDYQLINQLSNFQTVKNYQPNIENFTDSHIQSQNYSSQNLHNSPKSNSVQKPKPYVFLLINTVENLMKEGKISIKYLEEKTEITNNMNSNSESSFLSSAKATTNSNDKNSKNKNIINNKITSEFITNSKEEECENPPCHHIFNSSKDKIKIKIKGMKTQEKKLCEKCCEAVEKGDFCYYCNGIYRDGVIDTAVWVQCEFCRKWVHFDCELLKGKKYSNKQELIEEQKYMCPICSNAKAEQKNSESKLKKKLLNKKRKNDNFENQKIKNRRKEIKSEKCSELLKDVQMIESIEGNSL